MPRLLDGFKINMSHQEMDRLVEELDNLWKAFTMSDDGERTTYALHPLARGLSGSDPAPSGKPSTIAATGRARALQRPPRSPTRAARHPLYPPSPLCATQQHAGPPCPPCPPFTSLPTCPLLQGPPASSGCPWRASRTRCTRSWATRTWTSSRTR
jgi:hypothetical protein